MFFLRAKSARVITFEQFNQALTELAPKRFKGRSEEEALQKLYGLIVGKRPANIGVTVSILSFKTYLHFSIIQHPASATTTWNIFCLSTIQV